MGCGFGNPDPFKRFFWSFGVTRALWNKIACFYQHGLSDFSLNGQYFRIAIFDYNINKNSFLSLEFLPFAKSPNHKRQFPS